VKMCEGMSRRMQQNRLTQKDVCSFSVRTGTSDNLNFENGALYPSLNFH
jgi:hypothetical protein